jgi:hypothetical protein
MLDPKPKPECMTVPVPEHCIKPILGIQLLQLDKAYIFNAKVELVVPIKQSLYI